MTVDVLTSAEVDATADAIASWQLESGMIPWYPGGHSDPWNHIEAAMALTVAGRFDAAKKAYGWLEAIQLETGAWHQYYLADSIEQDKLDANVIAYIATGVWHYYLVTRDEAFLEQSWPMVERAINWVLELQQPGGEILWARHADGTPWSFALLTGSSSMYHSLRAALAISRELEVDCAHWVEPTERLGNVVRLQPEGAFTPKNRWAMDWYYPVLCGAMHGDDAVARLAARHDAFVMDGLGVRCVSDRPWVTTAETCETALAYLSVGDVATAQALFSWTRRMRTKSGRYWTGEVHPDEVHFPADEQSTYSSAAVLLADDALGAKTPASRLFFDHAALPV